MNECFKASDKISNDSYLEMPFLLLSQQEKRLPFWYLIIREHRHMPQAKTGMGKGELIKY